eukprot:TRINITY_DN8054_c0_g1_i2.p1 TRINITY_DN8054_c0_g1~~TRINITY_DN8054_c0_g1_i2.p1  ORF type:complete len:120 (+),score=2.65 TRINITY_DN8054_c0_g1_i2:273-632(+)
MGKRFAQTLELKPDKALIDEYIEYHKKVWPEVLHSLKNIGILHMTIWLHGNSLFMVCEVPESFDPSKDYQTYTTNAICQKWDTLMKSYQQRVPAAEEGEWWANMQEVFDLNTQLKALNA